MSFFPYNPRTVRLAFVGGAVACALLTAWALWGATAGTERFGEARAGISAGLMFAFLYGFFRLRPREGWGVLVEPERLRVSRPMSGDSFEIHRGEVEMIRRDGKRQDTVALYLHGGQRVLLSHHLFPSRAAFDRAWEALKTWRPEPVLDA